MLKTPTPSPLGGWTKRITRSRPAGSVMRRLLGYIEDESARHLVSQLKIGGPVFHLPLVEVLAFTGLRQAGHGQGQRQKLHEFLDLDLLAIGGVHAHCVTPFLLKSKLGRFS